MGKPRSDLSGMTFGRWHVIAFDSIRNKNSYWRCKCSCGQHGVVCAVSLKSGCSASCGCLRDEVVGKRSRTHGHTHSPTYISWIGMKQRSGLGKRASDKIARYGHVDADPRWAKFESFLEDMGARPSIDHTIDRIDNARGYWKDNCRWATRKQQAQNRGNCVLVSIGGETLCLKEACRRVGATYMTVYCRMRRGKSFEEAITSP